MDNDSESSCQSFLHGYSPVRLPDLSAQRVPSNEVHTATENIDFTYEDTSYRRGVALSTLARILGIYCGVSDIVLGIQYEIGAATCFTRIAYGEEQTTTDNAEHSHKECVFPLESLRRVLDFGEHEAPCVALCRFNDSFDLESVPSDYPLVFTFNSDSTVASVTSRLKHIHPTISSQLLSQFASLLQHTISTPLPAIATSPVFTDDLMSVYKRTATENLVSMYPRVEMVRLATDYLAFRAKDTPDSIAVLWYPDLPFDSTPSKVDPDSISYESLHKQANQVARWLSQNGLQLEDRVAVCMERNIQFHVAVMGILRAGGCYVPIDPELPEERKRYIAADSNARFIFTSAPSAFDDTCGTPISLASHQTQAEIQACPSDDVDIATPDNLAFLLYTSGTTGTPKGCLLTHHGLAQAILALSSAAADVRMDDLTEGRYLAVASIAFDVHLAETFVPLALGMPLLAAPRSILLEDLPLHIKALGISHVGIVPSLIEATMGAVEEEEGDDEGGMKLRYIASGGEKMSDSILEKWANHPKVRLANFYGPSEATIGCCARTMSRDTSKANIGRPFGNVSAYVVDANLCIIPRGGTGELVVEGPLVGRGYHGRPDLTEKVFMEWPEKGMWSYRTGDLVRMMPDSTLEILGRIDTQIKLRGVRIESEGISSIVSSSSPPTTSFKLDATTILAKHPSIGVDQLVTFIAWDTSVSISTRKSGKKPAVIAAQDTSSGLLRKIRKKCEAELASYMRPSHLIPLSWLPLNGNGKTDAKALASLFQGLEVGVLTSLMEQDTGGEERDEEHPTEPLTELEALVIGVLENYALLPLRDSQKTGALNLFECGLDSMGVIRFCKDLKDVTGRSASVSEVMKTPTVAGVAFALGQGGLPAKQEDFSYTEAFRGEWAKEVRVTYAEEDVECILPPFGVQEGVLARSTSLDTMYVQHVVVLCKEGVSLPQIRNAWESVMGRHAILRTVFHFSLSMVQVVLRRESRVLPWNVTETAMDVASNDFSRWFLSEKGPSIAKDINQNLSTVPPFRLNAYIDESITTVLVLSIHHALFDGISLPLLLEDVERLYVGSPSRATVDSVAILDLAASINLDEARGFWLNYFNGFYWPERPFRLKADEEETKHTAVRFKTSLTSLKASVARKQATLQALLTCTFAHLLATRMYSSNEVVFGVIRSGRLMPVDHIDSAMYPTLSVLPMRVECKHPDLGKIQNDISSAIKFEQLSLGQIQQWVRDGGLLFETLFSISVNNESTSSLWDIIQSEPPQTDFMLAIEVVLNPTTDSLMVQAAWSETSLSEEFVSGFLSSFEKVALEFGEGRHPSILPVNSGPGAFANSSPPMAADEGSFEAEQEAGEVDAELISKLQFLVCNFLAIELSLMTDTTSFVALGLDSIKSVGLSRVLRKQGFQVSPVQLMRLPTLQKLGRHIASGQSLDVSRAGKIDNTYNKTLMDLRTELQPADVALGGEDTTQVFPTTILQAGMLSQTIASRGQLYVHAFTLRIAESVDPAHLRASWIRAVELLSILRTSFHFIPDLGVWAQAIHSQAEVDWSTSSFTSVVDYEAQLTHVLSPVHWNDESLFARPPIRLRLFCPTPSSPVQGLRMVIVMHHALYDGLSIGKLLSVVEALYKGRDLGPTTQFKDILDDIIYQGQAGTSFWVNQLRDFRANSLPAPVDSPAVPMTHTMSRVVGVDAAYVERTVREACVTLQCRGQAVLAKLLGALTRSSDIIFGHVVSGRSIPGADDVIGPVLNTIPCRVQLTDRMRNAELLQLIHRTNVVALPWQHASLRSIQREIGIDPLWDILYLFQPLDESDSNPDALWEFEIPDEEEAKIQYPLNIEVHQKSSGLCIRAACRSNLMGEIELAALLDRFEALLLHMILHPDAPALEDVPELRDARTAPDDRVKQTISGDADHALAIDSHAGIIIQSLLSSITNIPSERIKSSTPLPSLGIDSITAIQIVAKGKKAGFRLTATDVVGSRTVGDLIRKIEQCAPAEAEPNEWLTDIEVPDTERGNIVKQFSGRQRTIENVTIVSPGMKWLIGAWQRSEGCRFQHAFAYRLPVDIDVVKMKAAWKSLVARHGILRSTFACAKGKTEPRLVTFAPGFEDETWSEELLGDETCVQSTVVAQMKHFVSSPFPTDTPVTTASLLLSSQSSWFVLHLHHFQYDAWSLQLLIDDLSALYKGAPPIASSDLSAFLRSVSPTPAHLSQQKEYWQGSFPAAFKPKMFPVIVKPSQDDLTTHKRVVHTSPTAFPCASACEARARSLCVSLSALLLACWAKVQAEYTGSSDSATFGLWQAGRTGSLDEIAQLAIPCMNVMPIHVQSLNEGGVIEVARRIQEDLQRRTAMIEQSDLEAVEEWVCGEGKPLCNVYVNLVKVAPDTQFVRDELFQPENVPYFVPDVPISPKLETLAVTKLIQDDVMIDIGVNGGNDAVFVSVEAAANVMDERIAKELVDRWVWFLQEALGV